jgi:tetratricopeptide (TPR) repeat protein
VHAYLEAEPNERSDQLRESTLTHPEHLFALCGWLRENEGKDPKRVATEAVALFRWLLSASQRIGLFDEREYLLGQVAWACGGALRHLGRLAEADLWLDRADTAYRHTLNPAPLLAKVAYTRLALRYDMRRYDEVLQRLPDLTSSFEKLSMPGEVSKCRFLAAMTLKESGRREEALEQFKQLLLALAADRNSTLLPMVLVEIGAALASQNRYDEAAEMYKKALDEAQVAGERMTVAHLKATLGETYRLQGSLTSAEKAFRAALEDYLDLGMAVRAAYLRVVLAESLILAGRVREGEWQILAALPTIEDQQMVPEGFAALTLLKESVHRRKTDPNALREVREILQARN